MADINKLKNKARREEQRENWSRAIELYKRALLESEKERDGAADLSLFNRIGDIHMRLGDKRTAVQFYEQAIQRYAEQDLHTSAIALCNKVLRILPDRVETIRQLGHLQAATGLVAEARGNYLRYAAEQMRHKRVDLALEALEECVEATADQQAGLRLAELFVELGRRAEALQRLQSLRERLAGRGTDVSRLEARIAELGEDSRTAVEADVTWAAEAEEETAGPATSERAAAAPAGSEEESEAPTSSEVESAEEAPAAAAPELPPDLQELLDRARPMPEGSEGGTASEEAAARGWPTSGARPSTRPDLPESTSAGRPTGRPGRETRVEGPERQRSTDRGVSRRPAPDADRLEPSVLSPAASADGPGAAPPEPAERRDGVEKGRSHPLAPAARFDPDGVELESARRSARAVTDSVGQPSDDDGSSAVAVEAEPAERSAPAVPWLSAPATGAEAPEGTAPPSPIGSASPADAAERRARPELRSPRRGAGAPEAVEGAPAADGETWMERGFSARSEGDLPAAIEAFGMALGSPAHLEEAFELVEACRRELEAQTASGEEAEAAVAEAAEPEEAQAAPTAEAEPEVATEPEIVAEAEPEVSELVPEEAGAMPEAASETEDASEEESTSADQETPVPAAEEVVASPTEETEPLATEHIPTIPVTGLPTSRTGRASAAPSGPDRDGEAAARREAAFVEWVHAAAPALLHATRQELEGRGELRRAAIVVDRLLELEPDRPELHRARVEYAQRLDDTEGAVRAEIGLAGCLERVGRGVEAREAYGRALALEPGSEAAREGLERLGSTDDDDTAAESDTDRQGAEERSEDGDDPSVHEAGGSSAEREGETMRHEQAERPGLGKPAVPGGDPTAVLDATVPPADRAPGDGPVPYDPLSGDAGAVDFEELLSELRTSLADNESAVDTRSHTEMGAELKAMGLLDEAIRELQAAVREPNAPAQAFELLGESFIEKGQARVATRLLAKAVAERQFGDRESLGVLYQLGVAYQETGEASKALECYERIFSIDIDYRDIKERILDCSP